MQQYKLSNITQQLSLIQNNSQYQLMLNQPLQFFYKYINTIQQIQQTIQDTSIILSHPIQNIIIVNNYPNHKNMPNMPNMPNISNNNYYNNNKHNTIRLLHWYTMLVMICMGVIVQGSAIGTDGYSGYPVVNRDGMGLDWRRRLLDGSIGDGVGVGVGVGQRGQQYQVNCSQQYYNTQTTINLGNCADQLFYITIGIGTPPQYFNLQVDTGSNILWVSTTAANTLGYNYTLSSTYTNTTRPYNETYVNGGQVLGSYGIDYVTVENSSVNVSYAVGFADYVGGLELPEGVLGVMGLGYTSVASLPNIFDLAQEQQQIQSNTFALTLLADPAYNSQLIYNQIPPELQNSTLYSSVYPVGAFYWQVELLGVMAGLYQLTQYAPYIAVIDSGTSLFYLNPPLANAFISQYLPTTLCNFTNGLIICNCSIVPTLPNISFIFTGAVVELMPEDYVQCYGCTCYVHIYTIQTSPAEVLLGDTLFNRYTVSFSKSGQEIGFAGGDVRKVYCFGESRGFVVGQYGMLGVEVIVFIVLTVLAYLVTRSESLPPVDQVPILRQRMTELFEMDKMPTPATLE